MGLLSNIVGSVKQSVVGKALDTLSAAFIKPGETVQAVFSPTKTVADVIKEVDKQSLGKNITATVVNTATAAAVVSGIGAIATRGVAATATSLIPSTIKGKIIAAVATPVVVGAVINQPIKSIQVVAEAPEKLANVGGNLAKLGAEPSLKNAETLVKENPVIVGGAIAAGTLAVGAGAVSALSNLLNRQEMKKQTEAFERQATAAEKQLTIMPVATGGEGIKEIPTSNTNPIPQVAETKTISKETAIKRRRKTKAKEKPVNVSQRVNVVVSNNSSTKKYLNRIILAH